MEIFLKIHSRYFCVNVSFIMPLMAPCNGLLYFRPQALFFFYRVTHVQVFQTSLLLNAGFFIMTCLRSSRSYLEGQREFINLNTGEIISNFKSEAIWKESPLSPIFPTCLTQFFMIVYNEQLHILFNRKIPRMLDTYFWDLYDRLPQQQNLERESKLEALNLLLTK